MSSSFLDSGNSPDLVPLPPTDQSHSAPFSSENGAQGGDSDAWQCTPPQSTSPSGETPAHPPPSKPGSRPCSRPASQSPSPPSALTGTKKRSTKPAHMRRNIRYFNLTSIHPENTLNLHAVLPYNYKLLIFVIQLFILSRCYIRSAIPEKIAIVNCLKHRNLGMERFTTQSF